ncbi:acetylcholinesterase-like [Oppia nitens]|uniref:acetylcholinesterase-like n=1 Tax=Oppia nitens TaxID=1686743 RepID=UPI0023DC5212|nr:acetylcholinesterase-like [Oppia nitens]
MFDKKFLVVFNIIIIIIILLLTTYSKCSKNQTKNLITVRLSKGLVNGLRDSYDGHELNVFLGIPYAQPPVGRLRFRRPLPLDNKPWTKPLDARHWAMACYHKIFHTDYYTHRQSEDCLYLNIWSPTSSSSSSRSRSRSRSSRKLKAVLFWIHGGGLVWGSAAEKFYNGTVLAALGDLVVVTINYRLNGFGLLYREGADGRAPGNQGLWDQTMAMKWVQKNIRSFGGDPLRVTIAGQSAGGESVTAHIMSPVSRQLFSRAIVMSGALVSQRSMTTASLAEHLWSTAATRIGCPANPTGGGGGHSSNQTLVATITPEMLDCLQSKPAGFILELYYKLDYRGATGRPFQLLVPDNQLIPLNYQSRLQTGQFKQGLNLLITTTQDEGSPLIHLEEDHHRYANSKPNPIDYLGATKELANIISLYFNQVDNQTVESINKFYFTGLSNGSDVNTLSQQLGIAFGDLRIGCPTILFGQMVWQADPRAAQVYQYYYNSKLGRWPKVYCAQWMGACHMDDIYYVFGLPFLDPGNYQPEERLLSREMLDVVTRFVKTGRPSAGVGQWPAYYNMTIGNISTLIKPYYEFNNSQKFPTNFGYNLKHIECNRIWSQLLLL